MPTKTQPKPARPGQRLMQFRLKEETAAYLVRLKILGPGAILDFVQRAIDQAIEQQREEIERQIRAVAESYVSQEEPAERN